MQGQSPWENADCAKQHRLDDYSSTHMYVPPRGSLGQFIERSTSAPPPSSDNDHDANGESLFGNQDTLEHVTKGYGEINLAAQSGTNFAGRHKPESQYLTAALLNTVGDDGGRATAPTISSSPYLQPAFMNGSSVSGLTNSNGGMYAQKIKEIDPTVLSVAKVDGLVRSQSAAPEYSARFASAPPGMQQSYSLHSGAGRLSHHIDGNFGRLSSSQVTESDQDDIMRPASKTLVDLIQERGTADEAELQYHFGESPCLSRKIDTYGKEEKRTWTGGTNLHSALRQQHQDFGLSHHIPTPCSGIYSYHGVSDYEQNGNIGGNTVAPASSRDIDSTTSHLSLQYSHLQRQSSSQLKSSQTFGGINHRQQMTHQAMPGSPSHQLYYDGQPSERFEAQVMPNGHTTYVNSSSSVSQPPQQPGVTESPHQFQSHPQTQFSISLQNQQQNFLHQTREPRENFQNDPGGRQYLSVLEVQAANQQLAYWSPEQLEQGLRLPATPLMSAGESGSLGSVSSRHVGMTGLNEHSASQYGRQRERVGRGRRATPNTRRSTDSKNTSNCSSSPLLEEFRTTKNRDWTMFQIEGHIVEFCQDQNGSRFIQQRLELGDTSEQQIVMSEVLPAIRRLRNDVFGNYVIQKLLDFGSADMKSEIRNTLESEMLQLSLQMYGCRVVQKALEALPEEELPRLLMEFHHNVLSCIHDQNENHVIQKCVEVINARAKKATALGDHGRAKFLTEQIEFIINDVLVNTKTLSCHPYGCRVLQRILEHCEKTKKTAVLDEICKAHRKLLDDQYGNYVIQHVLQFGRQSDRDSILHIVVENGLLGLSRQKFASNVVEKLLKYGNGSQRRAIVREMLKPNISSTSGSESSTVVLLMVRDAYANYVVQTTLDVVPESDEKRLLLKELSAHSEELVRDHERVCDIFGPAI
jgi:pumilio RNA-binding family